MPALKKHIISMLVCCCCLLFCCKKSGSNGQSSNGISTTNYTESTDDFPNPERGFYRYSLTKASDYTALSQSQLSAWRNNLTQVDGGNYQVYSTLVFRYFLLDIFRTTPLSNAFIDALKNDFAIARAAGVKLIPRFTYTNSVTAGSCPESWICTPYGDAPKAIVLQHIQQLKPVLTENADVIATVQLGFIGVWGEGYYTDYYGDASSNGNKKLLDENWNDRNELIKALLDALPADRTIQVRYPQMKQRFVYGVSSNVSAAAMSDNEAFNGTDKARIGYHNDCFLSSADDYGTYNDYGNSSTPSQAATETLRNYMSGDSKYVPVGGETCDDTYSPQNDCENAGIAETEMAKMHYSFLNCAYNNKVNDDWQTGGCMMNIKKRLGYRFVLKDFTCPKQVTSGTSFNITFNISNAGYASPYNERPIYVVLKNKADGKTSSVKLAADVRKWYPGSIKVDEIISIPSITPGTYDLYIYMPDKYASIAAKPDYAIRLANNNIWDAATGYNNLGVSVTVK